MRKILQVFSIFPRFSPTIFYRDANSVLLQILAHLSTAVSIGSMRRTPCLKLFVRGASRSTYTCTAGMFSRTLYACVSSRTLYALHPVSLRIFHLSPVLAYVLLSPGKSCTVHCTVFYTLQPKLMHLCTAVGSMLKTLCSKLVMRRA